MPRYRKIATSYAIAPDAKKLLEMLHKRLAEPRNSIIANAIREKAERMGICLNNKTAS